MDPKNGFAPGFDRGFALYDAGFHPPERGQNRFISVERPAAQVAARATNWLAHNSPGPFFLWIQLNDPEAASGNAYNAAIVAADAAVGKLVAALRTAKWYEDSVIVIASCAINPEALCGKIQSGMPSGVVRRTSIIFNPV